MKRSIAETIPMSGVTQKISGVKIGKIIRMDESGKPFVDFPGNTFGAVSARFTDSVRSNLSQRQNLKNRSVLLVFENDDPELPIILDTLDDVSDRADRLEEIEIEEEPKEVFIDGKRMTFNAREEIVLRCGKSSITLTRVGKIIIRGAYLLNRSSGVNRIKGASIQIN